MDALVGDVEEAASAGDRDARHALPLLCRHVANYDTPAEKFQKRERPERVSEDQRG
jgi:hypothetical protein